MMRTCWLVLLIVGVFVAGAVVLSAQSPGTLAGESAGPTPTAAHSPAPEGPTGAPDGTWVSGGPVTQDHAVAIARAVAATKGDARAELVSVTTMSLGEALTELSPGVELKGYDLSQPVLVGQLRGGPFDPVHPIPINRNPADFKTLFVVSAARA